VLDEQSLGALDRDRQGGRVLGERGVQRGQACHVMGEALLGQPGAGGVQHAELVFAAAPVDAGEGGPVWR
jgi:hypothetical protein